MDERYFLYFEDVDWCTRMQARGWTVHYVPQSTMTHHWQRASSQFSSSARTHLRSGLRFYERWGSFLYVLRQYRQTWTKMGLFLFDIMAITGSFLLAFLMRRQLAGLLEKPVWPLSYYGGFIVFSLLVFLGSFAANRLYREVRSGDWVDVFFRVFRAATIGSLLVMAGTFILDMQGFSRVLVLAVWPLSAVLAFLGRRILYASFLKARRERLNLRRVALLGTGETLDGLEQLMRQDLDLGWEPVRMRRAEITDERPADFLLKRLSSERVSDVVLTPEFFPEGSGDFGERMLPLRRAGIRVRVLSSFLASMPPRARLEPVGDMSWLSFERPNLKPAGFSKRSFDLIAATLLTVVGLVPVLLLALGRLLRRRPFLEPKGEFVGRWGETFTSRGIAGGGLLQGYPRLGSVFRGTCSLVGPRPLRPGEPTPGGEAWERVREHHRPGWLGPWTLTPVLTPNEEMQQELRYLEQWSPEGDLKLLVRVALNHSNGGSGRGTPTPATHTSDPKGAESAGITTGGSRLVGHEWS
ncbi:MAG: hypothetical protein HKN21_08135, partial [Candidatus Eisenbacteria bacterium]|nr:hypothetical protein [Candidatus Eisenbacteria bacterium]